MGLVAAVERYLSLDHEQLIEEWKATVARMAKGLSGVAGLEAYSRMPGNSGEPFSFCELRLLGDNATALRDSLVANLQDWDPPIVVSSILRDRTSINAPTLDEGQDDIIVEAATRIMKGLGEN